MAEKKHKNKNGEGSFRMQSGKWNYRFMYRDEFNVSKRKSITADTKLECLDKACDFLEQIEKKRSGADMNLTIVEILIEKFENSFEKNLISESSFNRNFATVRLINRFPIGSVPIRDITPFQMDEFLVDITEYSDSVISKIYQHLVSAFKIAKEKGLIDKNIMVSYDLRKPKSNTKKKKVEALDEHEYIAFVKALNEHKKGPRENDFTPQLLIEMLSGLRMGEINALTPDSIDLNKKVIHVSSTVSQCLDGSFTVKEGTKTDAGRRDVPICSSLVPIIEMSLNRMKNNKLNLIFYNHKLNKVIETNQVNSFYNKILEEAGISKRGQHSLRHTFATRCIEAGVPATVLKKWMGHTDIHVTLDTYADVFDRMNDNAIERFEEHLSKMGA